MKVVVFAYHEIGYVCLEELINFGAHILCLFTHKDDPGEEVWFRRPAVLAGQHGIPIYTPDDLKESKWKNLVADMNPDVLFSFYYRKMIPIEILDIPRIGAFNLHGSLLPKFRGRCPVNWALIQGETRTGLTLHSMVEKPDAGDIITQRTVNITFDDTAYTLFAKMTRGAQDLMREILPSIADGSFPRTPQAILGPSSYFGGRKPEDGIISWEKDAVTVYNLIRATTHPYPGAFTYLDSRRFFIWKAYPEAGLWDRAPGTIVSTRPLLVNTGKGVLRLLRVQWEGENEADGDAFAAAHKLDNKILGGTT
ncbi:MAG: Bifunctional polymyxin resistance protein ArnA [Syntrophorhabdus sp. PtaU1.Bin153]|nr:MAG: Bifunctional polymyxin resistance protein ArnA [Syntrophorhabdus sp. PtaU1.Bin153]